MNDALTYLSGHPIPIAPGAHVVVSAMRNEMLRLPFFLSYYRGIGFDHFLLIDNGSNDGTREFLLKQPDVFLFGTDQSFAASRFGMRWVNLVLDQFCVDRWILLADADELLVWPGSAEQSIKQLTAQLDAKQKEGLFTLLLDMYSDKPFGSIGYVPGEPFWAHCRFFDRGPYQIVPAALFPGRQIYGGVRARVFKTLSDVAFHPPTASKLPLLKWRKGQSFVLVAHGLAQPLALAPMRGALLHFKMFDDLAEKCAVEVTRKEHFAGAREYHAMARAIERSPNHSFFDPRFSVRYDGPQTLVNLGLMNNRGAFGA